MTSYDDLDAQLAALQATLKVEVQKVEIESFCLTLRRPIGLPPHAPAAQKSADQRR